jgi:hypothetical protein
LNKCERSVAHARRRPVYLSLLASVYLVTACASDASPSSDSDCSAPSCAANAAPIDWKSPAPVFTAQLRIVDAAGLVVPFAVVRHGSNQTMSNEAGLAQIGPIAATAPASVRVDKKGLTPQVVSVSAATAAQQRQTIVLPPLSISKDLKTSERSVIQAAGARVELAEQSLATIDGARAKQARVEMTYLAADTASSRLSPSGSSAISETGAPTVIAESFGSLFARFTGTGDTPLNLAVGTTAVVEFPIPASAGAKDGDVIALWALDEQKGAWKQESSCRVASRMGPSAPEQFCLGVVDHFSWWRVGNEAKVYEPGSVGCVLGTVDVVEPEPCYELRHLSVQLLRCNKEGAACVPGDSYESRLSFGYEDYRACSMLPTADVDATYRTLVRYRVGTDRCGDSAPKPGLRVKLSEPTSLQSFKQLLGSKVLLNFTLRPGNECAELCTKIVVPISLADLQDPSWSDADDDGFLKTTDAALADHFVSDCDDTRADTFPGAPEPFCVTDDRNCDQKTNPAYTSYADVGAGAWNSSCDLCRKLAGVTLPLSTEVALNEFDEDCDGKVEDRDGDKWSEPADCDDRQKLIGPGAAEVVGNGIDDNCDGLNLDPDGDGYFNPLHLLNLNLPPYLDKTKFTDCRDEDSAFHPGIDPKAEAGALRSFYYDSEDGVRRVPWFCNLFDKDGRPNDLFRATVKDRNCDGSVLDVDGDGFIAPDDCDDLDPRVFPTGEGPSRKCTVLANLRNDSVCNLASRDTAQGCPVLTLSGTDVVTSCEETKNADGTGTGLGACAFSGWWNSNPLVPTPATAWGPCDGDGPIPECAAGSSCGGPLPYTPRVLEYIQATYAQGAPIKFQGMCFPSCVPSKK